MIPHEGARDPRSFVESERYSPFAPDVSEAMPEIIYRGIPRTPDEWAALAKVASGHGGVSKAELRSLFMLGLVERQLGRICLSAHGRTTLGMPYHSHALTGSASAKQAF